MNKLMLWNQFSWFHALTFDFLIAYIYDNKTAQVYT